MRKQTVIAIVVLLAVILLMGVLGIMQMQSAIVR